MGKHNLLQVLHPRSHLFTGHTPQKSHIEDLIIYESSKLSAGNTERVDSPQELGISTLIGSVCFEKQLQ